MSSQHSERIPVALLGYGGSGSGIHRHLISAIQQLRLATVIARDPERIRQAQEDLPEAQVTSDLTAVEDCAVVVVAIPPAGRSDIVEGLLRAGKYVVVEKPMASGLAETLELVKAVPEPRLTVFHNRRWDSDFLTLEKLRTGGAWTSPARLESRIQWWQPQVRDSWRNNPEGGGILTEVGTHVIDQAIKLLGPVTSVFAELTARRHGAKAEDDVFIALEHADGSQSHLSAGPLGSPDAPRFRLITAETLITLGTADPQQSQLASGITPLDESWGRPESSDWTLRNGNGALEPVTAARGGWEAFYDGVAKWAANDGSPAPVSVEEGMATMRVVDAARRSAADSRVVHLREWS
ncbi:Gfo/Idh/MocA family protein [Arthrobacter sp. MMS24-S77]